MENIQFTLGVMSGKGGVGKSSITALFAEALAEMGLKVGILDADIYGPSETTLFPIESHPTQEGGLLLPATSRGIRYMSIGMLLEGDAPAMVRAPIANQMILQFLTEVNWGELDYLLIDFPPGTGDVQLTLMQHASFLGTIAVTTPSPLSLIDVRKAIEMSLAFQIPVLGVIENYSFFYEAGGKKSFPFGKDGGRKLSEEYNLPLLGEIPLDPQISMLGGSGKSLFREAPSAPVTQLVNSIAHQLNGSLQQMVGHERGDFHLNWNKDLC